MLLKAFFVGLVVAIPNLALAGFCPEMKKPFYLNTWDPSVVNFAVLNPVFDHEPFLSKRSTSSETTVDYLLYVMPVGPTNADKKSGLGALIVRFEDGDYAAGGGLLGNSDQQSSKYWSKTVRGTNYYTSIAKSSFSRVRVDLIRRGHWLKSLRITYWDANSGVHDSVCAVSIPGHN